MVEFQKTGLQRTNILKLTYLLITATLGAKYKKKISRLLVCEGAEKTEARFGLVDPCWLRDHHMENQQVTR
jgi:hypothetical protein